jgi:trehalose 6-phosphate phosphatase
MREHGAIPLRNTVKQSDPGGHGFARLNDYRFRSLHSPHARLRLMPQVDSSSSAGLHARGGHKDDAQRERAAGGPAGKTGLTVDFDQTAILLDIDGTLLDIAPRPHDVHVSDELRAMLAKLAERLDGALGLISGRSLADIDAIFEPLRLAAVGGHGAEIRPAAGAPAYRMQLSPLDPKLKLRFAEIALLDPGIIIEDKDYSLAIHYRLAPQLGGTVITSVAAICEESGCDGLSILPGKSVIEIKPRGFDKGSGLKELMSVAPFAGRKPVFVGDDVTDEAAFAMLPRFSGIGVSVGGIVPGASFNFDGPKDVRLWLRRLSSSPGGEVG